MTLASETMGADASVADTLNATTGRSLRQIVISRLRRDRVAMVALGVLIFVYLLAIVGPFVAPMFGLDPFAYDRDAVNSTAGGPVLPYGGISLEHPLGVEWGTGRDIAAQLLWGLRISLIVATSATMLVVFLGVVIGIIAGYAGGWTDMIPGRFMDLILAFPTLLILIAMSAVFTQRLTDLGVPPGNPSRMLYLILAISAFGWPYLARIVRGQVLSLREREFVDAARVAGARDRRIIFRHILPNAVGVIIVNSTLLMATAILLETALSFLGFGVQAPDTSLGKIISDNTAAFATRPWLFWWPGIFIVLIALSVNFIGDGLRDAFDPRQTRVRA